MVASVLICNSDSNDLYLQCVSLLYMLAKDMRIKYK